MTAREDRLESWKEISAYLERTTRTCQKWEAEYGLPIYRLKDSPKSRVYAYKAELDAWLERVLRETEGREAAARPLGRTVLDAVEVAPDPPPISRSAVADKSYWTGRKATERFLATRDPAELAMAVDMFEKVRDEDPDNPLAYLGLGDAYRWDHSFQGMRPDRLSLMTENYARAYRLAPDLAETNIGLGWSRYFPGDFTGAGRAFARAAKIKPDDPEINLEIANFLIGIGHPDRAVPRFSRIIAGSSNRSRALWLRAVCYEWLGEYAAALADGRRALEIEPTSGYLRCMQARVLILTGDLAEAEAELAVAAALFKGGGDVEFTKALLWAARGERKKAEDALARPARPTVLRNYIETMVAASLGHTDEAIDLIARTIETGFSKLVSVAYFYLFLANPNNHFYDPLRRDPRFPEILARQKRRHEEESARLGDL
ncbi:MAG TPA: tetratricopeptide repeat protein [Acidobacteriota bacterium]|nr:tetratricopeptide repeat protein [Acidobacteriota bacterium]